ncbi:winged helix-turn-helix transcriptional regulator [Solihabitans fulvus]|nr:winged helix-turn-helix transcriptional regulator [Solihabitans fulvus]
MTTDFPLWPGIYDVVRLLDGEWVSAVLAALQDQSLHYTEILTVISRQLSSSGSSGADRVLHETTLTRTLRRLVRDGLVERVETRSRLPRSVRYSLTEPAKELLTAMASAAKWAEYYNELIEEARQRRAAS